MSIRNRVADMLHWLLLHIDPDEEMRLNNAGRVLNKMWEDLLQQASEIAHGLATRGELSDSQRQRLHYLLWLGFAAKVFWTGELIRLNDNLPTGMVSFALSIGEARKSYVIQVTYMMEEADKPSHLVLGYLGNGV